MKAKRVYLLPHNDTYKLVGSFYTGGIEGNGFLACDNCNAMISRVAIIHTIDNSKKYYVGFDCAKTLSSLKEEDITKELELFKYGESIRRSLLNRLKVSTISVIYTQTTENNIHITLDSDNNGRNGYHTTIKNNEFAKTHILPQINDLIGYYIDKIKITKEKLKEFEDMLEVGMEFNKTSYHQSILDINKDEGFCVVKNLYMGDKAGTSKASIRSVLGKCLNTPKIKERLDKEKVEYLTKKK